MLLRWFLLFKYLRHIWEFPKFTNSKFGNIYPQFKVFLSICTVMAALQRSRGKSCTKSWNLTRESKMSSFSKNKSSFQPKSGREKKVWWSHLVVVVCRSKYSGVKTFIKLHLNYFTRNFLFKWRLKLEKFISREIIEVKESKWVQIFCESHKNLKISPNFLTLLCNFKKGERFFQVFMAFSEYLNF